MRRSPARSGSGLARKRRHSINSSARTRRPGANIKMSDHSMLGGARTGGEFHPAQFYSMPTNATNCGRCFSEKDLYGYRQGAISVMTGPPPLDARTRRRSLRLLGHSSRWNTASASIPSESNQWRQTHSWTSPWESIQRAVARSVVPQECKNFFQHAGYVRDRIRSNCAFLAAKSLSIWLSLGGMDGN
jgi:hypothetical protein